ncbi:MAG: right-handed parallel beta-helix repeat-containing protein [Phycisphaeraceae bacterium]|nr:right-handed parallel beta-helix repeat-containing protein [Phycisphaeraceae bacterium]MCB9848056.1 right-handed parallel beta-helix repeat-containing protein [Phycisphaeraceae bacterium]
MRHRDMLCIGSALFLAIATTAMGGDLNPPPGQVAPTNRVILYPGFNNLPVVIDEPGSYVLGGPVLDCVGCLNPLPPTSGIVISASDVTLDCNGFQIVGAPADSFNGIFIDAPATNVVIRNGTVRDWSNTGIIGGSGVTLENMRVIGNGSQGGGGIELSSEARVVGCTVVNNNGAGVFVGYGSVVEGCTASGNIGDGIHTVIGATVNGSVVRGCVARGNAGTGFSLGDGTVASDCAATQNGAGGFVLAPGALASTCTAALNTGDGFNAVNALVLGCSAALNTGSDIALSFAAEAINSHDSP